MNLDLTGATEAAKTAAFLCGVRKQRDEFIIAAAAPLIAAQVAEQIAAAILAAKKRAMDGGYLVSGATYDRAAQIAREAVR